MDSGQYKPKGELRGKGWASMYRVVWELRSQLGHTAVSLGSRRQELLRGACALPLT